MSRWANMIDGLQNFVTGLGMLGVDPNKAVQYVFTELDRFSLENMYRGDWLARRICDAPAEDMTREWRAWQASQKQIEALENVEKALDIRRKVKNMIIKARLYGGSALILGVDDGNDPAYPIDLKKCSKDCLKYVVVVHRWELNAGPRIYNVSDPYYTRPAYYTVATPMFGMQGETGTTYPNIPGQPPLPPPGSQVPGFFSNVIPFMKRNPTPLSTMPTNIGLTQIHPSRVLELPGNELPDWRLAPMGGGWGDSVLQTVVDEMQSFTTTMRSTAAMVNDGKLDVVKIPEMALRIDTPGYKGKLIDRFMMSTQTKSVISALLLDKEEEWDRVTTNYAGLPMIMHEFMTLVAGAAGMPVSRLFGQAQGQGLSGGSTAGGADDLRNWFDQCASEQKNEITPRIMMLDEVLKRSALGSDDPNIHYDWNPLWQLSDDEKGKLALAKAQATQIYATIGVINEDAFREGVVNQLIEDGTYPGLDDAIEKFGSEPEEPTMGTGGYMPRTPEPEPDAGTGTTDYSPNQPRGISTPGTTPGSFAPSEGGAGVPNVEWGAPSITESPAWHTPAISESGEAQIARLHDQWSYLEKQLGQYVDKPPNDPVARKLTRAQLRVVDSLHAVQASERKAGRGLVRDVVVVGSGPAGLSASVYGASEGLDTMLAEASSDIGGQAAASSRIENVIGFPIGVSGDKLTRDAVQQAKRLGADVQTNKRVTGMNYDDKTGVKTLSFADGTSVQAKTVVIAGGVQFRKMPIPGADSPDVVYGSSAKLLARTRTGDSIIVGGANSAGQAAMNAANTSKHVTLMIRSPLAKGMSDYLVKQIEAHPRITVKQDEITEIKKDANGRMTGAMLKSGELLPARGVLYAIGSKPETDWASGVERDDKGFIKVGGSGRAGLETSIPGVFAVGDVRSDSVKRVASSAGDGAVAISMTHGFLKKMGEGKFTESKAEKKARLQKQKQDIEAELASIKDAVKMPDAATKWLHEVYRYDRDEQPWTGYPTDED